MRVAFLGLGLVGGSLARALHDAGWDVTAWTPAGTGPRAARAAGAVDVACGSVEQAVRGAEMVVLSAPVSACLELLDRLGGAARSDLDPDAVVTDVASTKVLMMRRAAARGVRFVGGHPMAGRETSGFDASDRDLFRGRPWVVVAPDSGDDRGVTAVEAMALEAGARPVRMTAAEHDDVVAGVSHVPLVLAAALVEAVAGGPGEAPPPTWETAAGLASGGWAGATRLARGEPAMGAAIMRTNAGPLAAGLRDVRLRLDAWLALLEADAGDGLPDESVLRERLAAARVRLEGAE